MFYILILILFLILFVYYVILPLFYWKFRGVPYIPAWPIFGSLLPMLTFKKTAGCLLESFYNHPRAEGKSFIGFHTFYKPAILIRDPELIKKVFIKDFNYFSDRFSYTSLVVDPLGSRTLFFIKGNIWKQLRVALTPIFTSKRMREMFVLVDECGKNLASYFEERVSNQNEEIREIIARCTTDVIVSCAFGIECNCLRSPDSQFRNFGKELFNYNLFKTIQIQSVFLAPDIFTDFLKAGFFNKKLHDFFHQIFWDIMHEREKSGCHRPDLVGLLIDMKKELMSDPSLVKKFDYEGDDLLAQATMFFAAGFETTSTTVSFTLYELSRSPIIQFRTRKDILSAIQKHGGMTYDALADMTYLDQVIQETLRKYPPLPILDRLVMNDYQIPGTKTVLTKGTPVFISLYGLHYDPTFFKNPKRFDPDRFSKEGKEHWPAFAYLPFGDGPRNCIGTRFGLMVVKTLLAHVLSRIEVRPNTEQEKNSMEFNKYAVFTQSKDGIYLQTKLCQEM